MGNTPKKAARKTPKPRTKRQQSALYKKQHPYAPRVGRPPKFETVKQMEEAINAYFASCWEPVMLRRLKKEAHDKVYHDDEDYEWVEERDHTGEPVYRQRERYTVTGLALALGMTRQGLIDYEGKAKFADTVKQAKQIVEAQNERELYTPKIAAGVIFNLKNNFGWADRTDITSGDKPLAQPLLYHAVPNRNRDGEDPRAE